LIFIDLFEILRLEKKFIDRLFEFDQDGDYNRQIPEMQTATNKKFCTTSNGNASVNSSNFLCEKCNNFQELKMIELKNFESKSDVCFFLFINLLKLTYLFIHS
jgi:hypothetical protein